MLSNSVLCNLLDIEHPIIQGGMALLGTAELVSAVSNAGCLGVIGSGDAPPSWLREQIELTRKKTDKPFAVNILLMSPFISPASTVTCTRLAGLTMLGSIVFAQLAGGRITHCNTTKRQQI